MTLSTEFTWTGRFDGDSAPHRRLFQIINQTEQANFTLIGFASDEGVRRNKGRLGAQNGPNHIRSQMGSMPVHRDFSLNDAGNIICENEDLETAQNKLAETIKETLHNKSLPIILGGGHEVAFGSFQGAFRYLLDQKQLSPNFKLGIINFDAHFDLREADQVTSGTPFLNAADLSKQHNIDFNYLCLGIAEHGNTKVLFDKAHELNVTYLYDHELSTHHIHNALTRVQSFIDAMDYLYITVDLDSFPAYLAPGVSAPSAKGFSLEAFDLLFDLITQSKKVIVLDIAECNPEYDIDHRTAKLAAYIVYQYIQKSFIGLSNRSL